VRYDARVARVDAVDVGVDLAEVRRERCGQGDAGGIRAAAAESGDVVVAVDPLETGHDRDRASVERDEEPILVDRADARPAEGRVGGDAHLMTEKRRCLHTEILEREREERCRDLLTARDQRIALALRGVGRHLSGEREETIGFARHGGDHHHQAVPLLVIRGHAPGDLADPLDATDRGAAVFLNDQCHR